MGGEYPKAPSMRQNQLDSYFKKQKPFT